MADSKLSALTADTAVLPTDLGYTVEDPGGTPTSKKATWLDIVKGAAAGLPIPRTVQTKTTTYTAVAGDIVLASASGGAWALTLPAVASGAWVTVKKTDSSANAITVTPASGTIDGAATYVIDTQYVSRDFVSNGTDWLVV